MNAYPFWVLVGLLYLSILLFASCGVIMWMPSLVPDPFLRYQIGQTLFSLGSSTVGIGGITAPVMDLILHHDINTNNQ